MVRRLWNKFVWLWIYQIAKIYYCYVSRIKNKELKCKSQDIRVKKKRQYKQPHNLILTIVEVAVQLVLLNQCIGINANWFSFCFVFLFLFRWAQCYCQLAASCLWVMVKVLITHQLLVFYLLLLLLSCPAFFRY